jgi:CHASE3 domain sensor protein
MSEPTIDEMLKYLEQSIPYSRDIPEYAAIRAILEAHRDIAVIAAVYETQPQIELEAIRAFVDKASKHVEPLIGQPNYYGHFYIAIKEFLDEMENPDDRTND